jgi:hypothetical protein
MHSGEPSQHRRYEYVFSGALLHELPKPTPRSDGRLRRP